MLTEKEMNKIAEKYISDMFKSSTKEVVLLQEHTIEKSYGSIYFYNSKKYIEDDDFNFALVGNAPFLIEKKTGKIVIFGTSHDIEYYIEEYESGRWIPALNK